MHFRERHCIGPEDALVGEDDGGHGSYFVSGNRLFLFEKMLACIGKKWGQIFVA